MDLPKKTVLIVEDEEALLRVLTDGLEAAGLNILTAKDGQQGLSVASEESVDLILLDIVMPNMDGMEMLRRLKNTEATKKIPVILLTNIGDTDKILEAKELEAEDYLIKSNFKIDEVIKLIKEKLGF